MTNLTPDPQDELSQEKHRIRMNSFFNQTVTENNQRINGKNINSDTADEIKFIQSILLTSLNPTLK